AEVHGSLGSSVEGVALAAEEGGVVEGEAAEGVPQGAETAEGVAGVWEAGVHMSEKSLEMLLMLVSAVMALGGIGLAFYFYVYSGGRDVPAQLSEKFRVAYSIFTNGWYFDALYKAVFVDPYMKLSTFFLKAVDVAVIDNIVRGVAGSLLSAGNIMPGLQLGVVRWYATVMVLGAIIIILYI
ncbi:MAG: hypothetical protein V3V54_05270, partial [Candidatus Brocadiales bacterium]